MKEILKLFDKLDTNHSGYIDYTGIIFLNAFLYIL